MLLSILKLMSGLKLVI